MVEHTTDRVMRITQHSTLDRVLDQLREGPSGSVTLLLDPLSVLFATPDHFRALDAVRLARRLAVTIEVQDAHRTGLALAFGYRVRPPGDHPPHRTMPVPDVQYGPPNRTRGIGAVTSQRAAVETGGRRQVAPVVDASARQRARRSAGGREGGARSSLLIALCSLLVALIAFCALLIARFQTADVFVQPAEESFSRVVPFAVSVTPTDDPNTLATTSFETIIARDGDAPATGKATVPDGAAAGAMTFRSRADGTTAIKAGTALKGPKDISYVLQSDIVVPGLNFVRGQLGEVTAKVQASQPGPTGNLGAGYSARYTDNVTYISGEIAGGTEKQVPIVTDDDIAALRARLEREARLRALTDVNASLPAGATALNDYLTLRTPTTTAQPVAGTQAESVHVRLAIAAQVPVYQNSAFDALIDRRLTEVVRDTSAADSGSRQVLPETVLKAKPTFVDVQGSLVRYFASVTGQTRAVVTEADLARLRGMLVSRDAATVERLLATDSRFGGHTIRYGPAWLPKIVRERMPRTASAIHLHLGTTP